MSITLNTITSKIPYQIILRFNDRVKIFFLYTIVIN